jgi:hypothetical protein
VVGQVTLPDSRGTFSRVNAITFSAPSSIVRAVLFVLVCAVPIEAQTTAASDSRDEDVEPLQIAGAGTTLIGISGFFDQFFVPGRAMPANYAAELEAARFITARIAVHGGLRGAGSIGGDTTEDLPTGTGAMALHAIAGARFYFTPRSIASLYAGGEYWAQLTRRIAGDAGTAFGIAGVDGALSSRATVFLEGGYGVGLTREEGDLRRRMVGRLGVRLKF